MCKIYSFGVHFNHHEILFAITLPLCRSMFGKVSSTVRQCELFLWYKEALIQRLAYMCVLRIPNHSKFIRTPIGKFMLHYSQSQLLLHAHFCDFWSQMDLNFPSIFIFKYLFIHQFGCTDAGGWFLSFSVTRTTL